MKKLPILTLLFVSLFLVWCAKQDQAGEVYTSESWKTIIPESCQTFYDWCNTCIRLESDPTQVWCTKMFCETYAMPYCADEEKITVDDNVVDDAMAEEDNYLWLTIEEAADRATQNGVPFRLVEIDGVPQAVTMDYSQGRINATSQDGVIVSWTVE